MPVSSRGPEKITLANEWTYNKLFVLFVRTAELQPATTSWARRSFLITLFFRPSLSTLILFTLTASMANTSKHTLIISATQSDDVDGIFFSSGREISQESVNSSLLHNVNYPVAPQNKIHDPRLELTSHYFAFIRNSFMRIPDESLRRRNCHVTLRR